MYKILPTSHKP